MVQARATPESQHKLLEKEAAIEIALAELKAAGLVGPSGWRVGGWVVGSSARDTSTNVTPQPTS